MAVILLTCNQSLGQNKTEDVIYLKDGGTIGGTITENIPSKTITIKTRHGSTLVVKYDEIVKITKEPYVDDVPPPDALKYKYSDSKSSGVIGYIELNYCLPISVTTPQSNSPNLSGLSIGENLATSIGLKAVVANRVSKTTTLGLGIGIDKNAYTNLLPITGELRMHLNERSNVPFINISAGRAFGLNNLEGGLQVSAQVGVKILIDNDISWTFSLGLKRLTHSINLNNSIYYYTSSGGYSYYNNTITSPATFYLFSINSGISF